VSLPTIAGYDSWKTRDFRDDDREEVGPYVSKSIHTTIGGLRCEIWTESTDDYCTPKCELTLKNGQTCDLEEIAERHPRIAERIADKARGIK
jgi:hypothetical protein